MKTIANPFKFISRIALAILTATAVSVFAQTEQTEPEEVLDIVLSKTVNWCVDGKPIKLPYSPNTDQAKIGSEQEFIKTNCVYTCELSPLTSKFGKYKRYLVRFDGCGRVTVVTLNGEFVGMHNGEATPFTFDLTQKLNFENNATNFLSVIASNKDTKNLVPLGGYDRGWGPVGIFDDVHLIVAPINAHFNGYIVKNVEELPEIGPGLFHYSDDMCESFCVNDILSNVPFGWYNQAGQKVILHGVCYQRDGPLGMIMPREVMERDLQLIKLMGCNAIRTTHRPMNEFFYDWCDRHGIYVLTEIPMIGAIGTQKQQENGEMLLVDMIMNFKHHPCILAWGVGNEINGNYSDLATYVAKMKRRAKELDPTRPIYFVQCNNEGGRTMTDILGLNIYSGWYQYGDGSKVFKDAWDRAKSWDRHEFLISEYGFGANIDQSKNNPTFTYNPNKNDFQPMEWQTLGHINAYRSIQQNESTNSTGYVCFAGSFIYQMFDSYTPLRNEGGIPFTNTKGLITRDRKRAKDAYYFYKANWNPQPMLHLCGKKDNIAEIDTSNIFGNAVMWNVTVFCNTGKDVKCALNGEHIDTKTPDSVKVVNFQLSLSNTVNKITVTDGKFTETATVTLKDISNDQNP